MSCRAAYTLWFLLPTLTWAGGAVEELLSSNPAIEAAHAISAGDTRHIVIPVCAPPGGEVIPGWPIHNSAEVQTAIERGRRPVTCNDIGLDAGSKIFLRLAKYAEIYNQTILRFDGKPVGITNQEPGDCQPISQ